MGLWEGEEVMGGLCWGGRLRMMIRLREVEELPEQVENGVHSFR